jgi:hypothetical protein
MHHRLKSAQYLSVAMLAALLGACGGGGGGTAYVPPPVVVTPPAPVTPVPPPCVLRIVGDTAIEAGKAGGVTVQACNGSSLDTIVWSQVSGPGVTLLAGRSPTVSFETPVTGTIVLRADATLLDGTTGNVSTSIAVSAAPTASSITLRLDHAVRSNTNTSVRAWPTLRGGDSLTSISWSQIEGPTVTMDTRDNRLLTFKSPDVQADTVLRFRALMTTSSGRQDSDDVYIGVERQAAPPKDQEFDQTARVHPYRMAAAYAPVLKRCVYENNLYYTSSSNNNFCTAGTLPLLAEEAGIGNIPTVEQVMGRVLVSHDFLGANFENFLRVKDANGDFRRLLAGVTAVVIGSHVRPSFYTPGTGAIYLDANNLWLNSEQRDVVTEVPDYRLAFDVDLNYSAYGRLVRNNAYAVFSYPSTSRNLSRDNDALMFSIGRLLFHELGHASDYFPPANRTLNPNKTIWDNVVDRSNNRLLPSDALAQIYPLRSQQMFDLAQVSFWGATATAAQRAYTAADVGGFFASDRANDDYAYSRYENSNSREDLAMLFEDFMMTSRQNVQTDIAFGNKFQTGMTGDQIIIAWGQRGRIGDPVVKPRIKLVLSRMAPWIDPAEVDNLPAPLLMRSGSTWNNNLVLGNAQANSSARIQGGASAERPGADQARDDVKRPRH